MNLCVGKRIKELRSARGMTQSELAKKIRVTTSAVSSYEVTERQPSYDVLIKVAYLFNVTTDYLLGLDGKDMLDITGLCTMQRESVQRLVETYQKFNELTMAMFNLKRNEGAEIEFYYNASLENFREDMQTAMKRKNTP